jgi:hypothetical protein
MFLTINGGRGATVTYVPHSGATVDFVAPEIPGGDLWLFISEDRCYAEEMDTRRYEFPGGGAFSISQDELFNLFQDSDGLLAIYAIRSTDGAESPCVYIKFRPSLTDSESPTATPSSLMTPEPTPPPGAPPAPTTLVTGLPQTGSGSGAPPGYSTILLVIAIPLVVAAFGIERRRRFRRARE